MRRAIPMLLPVLVFGALGPIMPTVASAQSSVCWLSIDPFWTDKNSNVRPVRGARAVAVRSESTKRIPAVLVSGKPRFLRLPGGYYQITVTKPGFKRTIQDVSFTCAQDNAEATVKVELQPGTLRRTVVAMAQSITANRRGVTTVIGTADPSQGYAPPPAMAPSRTQVFGGVMNGQALVLPKAEYPPIARSAHASGRVTVQIVIDEEGNVISADAVSGHPLLQNASLAAARGAKFSPRRLSGQPVKVTGLITYNFVAQ